MKIFRFISEIISIFLINVSNYDKGLKNHARKSSLVLFTLIINLTKKRLGEKINLILNVLL